MSVVKIGWSGGKDSTRAVMEHIKRGDKVKVVCYVPMFTKEIPLITKKHYEFIKKTAQYFKSLGAQFYWADDGLTYYEYVTHIAIKGKYKGKIFSPILFVLINFVKPAIPKFSILLPSLFFNFCNAFVCNCDILDSDTSKTLLISFNVNSS